MYLSCSLSTSLSVPPHGLLFSAFSLALSLSTSYLGSTSTSYLSTCSSYEYESVDYCLFWNEPQKLLMSVWDEPIQEALLNSIMWYIRYSTGMLISSFLIVHFPFPFSGYPFVFSFSLSFFLLTEHSFLALCGDCFAALTLSIYSSTTVYLSFESKCSVFLRTHIVYPCLHLFISL